MGSQYLLTCCRVDHHSTVAVSVFGCSTCIEIGLVGVHGWCQLFVSTKDHLLALKEGARHVRLALLAGAELRSLLLTTGCLPLPIIARHHACFILTALARGWELVVHGAVFVVGVLTVGCAFALSDKLIHTLSFFTVLREAPASFHDLKVVSASLISRSLILLLIPGQVASHSELILDNSRVPLNQVDDPREQD